MKEHTRGRVLPSARVFKIKDAKKALSAACAQLKLPYFSQRNLRQSLIRRLIRAKLDVKSISKWQGHQDGGQLILDTYTEVFGDDEDAYEQIQLAKLGGGEMPTAPVAQFSAPVAQFHGDREANAPSSFMKKRMKKARPRASVTPVAPVSTPGAGSPAPVPAVEPAGPAESAPVPVTASAPPPAAACVEAPAGNPYLKGDKVTTKCKGADVEAEVTAVFRDEVQVRTPDGELRWRTIRTVPPVIVLLTPPDPMDAVEPSVVVPRKRKRATKKDR